MCKLLNKNTYIATDNQAQLYNSELKVALFWGKFFVAKKIFFAKKLFAQVLENLKGYLL
jgi:hypothetical protein